MALEQFRLDGRSPSVYLCTRDCYVTVRSIFHVDGGIESNNSPLAIPDY